MGKFDDNSRIVIEPSGLHTHSLVMLHGRGSNAHRFAFDFSQPEKPGFLQANTSSGQTIQERFPGLRIIFPQAPLRRCTARKRIRMNIWFDSASFEDPAYREELHIEGIRTNSEILAKILEAEAALLAWDKLFLGGLSQGCAMAIYTLARLNIESDSLAGFIGLSGWLPFQDRIQEILLENKNIAHDDNENDDPFSSNQKESPPQPNKPLEVVAFMRKEVLDTDCGMQTLDSLCGTSFFLGHGAKDTVVPPALSSRLAETIEALGCRVVSKEYPELEHWFEVPAEIDDLVDFIESRM